MWIMTLALDQKFSTFAVGGPVVIGDIIVGLRGGINTKFIFDAGVTTVQGTLNQVLVNNSVGVPVSGAVVLSAPQDIATTSSPTFNELKLSTATAYTLIAGGTTSANPLQSLLPGTAGQLLQSNGAAALPTWTAAAFPIGPGTLNHLLRSDGTNWVETTATTIDASDVMSGLTQLNVDNLRLDGNTISSTDTNGLINLIPDGAGATQGLVKIGYSAVEVPLSDSVVQIASVQKAGAIDVTTYWNANTGSAIYLSASSSEVPGVSGAVDSARILAQIVAEGDDGVTGMVNGAEIKARASGAISSGVVPAQWEFYTSTTLGVRTLGMTLTNAQILNLANPLPVASGGTNLNSAGSSGTILRSNGTTWLNSTATFADTYSASSLLYSNGANTVTGLATANNGILVTSAGGIPSIGNTIGASISVTGTVTGTTGFTTGISGSSSGLITLFTDNAGGAGGAQIYEIAKSVASNTVITILQITVPATAYFISVEAFFAVSRAPLTVTGTSFVQKKYFSIARQGSGSDVVLDGDATFAANIFSTTTTTAGGIGDATSGATTIVRNGAEPNTDPQVVNITINPTVGGSSGLALAKFTINVLGSATGLVIA